MKKYNQVLGVLLIMLVSQFGYAGNFDNEYNFMDIRCKSKTYEFNFMIEHLKISGIRSITENIFEHDGVTLEDQMRRVFMVHVYTPETRFIISQKIDNNPLGQQDPVVVLYVNSKELLTKTHLKISIGKGTLEQVFNSQINAEDADCHLLLYPQDSDSN